MFLTLTNISKSYGPLTVLDDVSFTLAAGQRVGLVGANGVGKSTLFKIITRQIEADGGAVRLPSNTALGYLPQSTDGLHGSLNDLIEVAVREVRGLESELRLLEEAISEAEPDMLPNLYDRYALVTESYEALDGYETDQLIETTLAGLGVGHLDRARPVESLSGGEKSRVQMALLLLRRPDVLLLDEPTNHLDAASLGWLEATLSRYAGALLMVSHDRQFLNKTVTGILDIDEHSHRAKHYTGDYDAYLAAKIHERAAWEDSYAAQQEELHDLQHALKTDAREVNAGKPTKKVAGDKFAKGFFKGRTEVAVSRRVENVRERIARIESEPIPKPPKPLAFAPSFDPSALESRAPLAVAGLSKGYGGRALFADVSFALTARARIALVGENGAGKSTLMRVLAGVEKPDSGSVSVHPRVLLGYLDQDAAALNPAQTVIEAFGEGLIGDEVTLINQVMMTGLFRYEEVRRTLGQLSSGQRRKLQIARLMATGANLLLLDEPTNHISLDVLEEFEDALLAFPGPIVAVSHDRRFIGRFAHEIWEVEEGALRKYAGGWVEYSARMEARALAR
jgi:macrolide transport system ATP-binding/permease protein